MEPIYSGIGGRMTTAWPVCYSMAGKSQIMHPSVALAVVSTIGFLGFLLCPPTIGFIAHASSLRHSFALIAVFGLMTAVLARFLRRN